MHEGRVQLVWMQRIERIGQWAAGFLGYLYWLLGRRNLYITLLYFLTLPFSFPPHATSCIYSQYIRSSHSHRPRALPGTCPQSIPRPCTVTHSMPLDQIHDQSGRFTHWDSGADDECTWHLGPNVEALKVTGYRSIVQSAPAYTKPLLGCGLLHSYIWAEI